jgi:ubiquinone/menaquinone biosynthesis C-methylase UbiE
MTSPSSSGNEQVDAGRSVLPGEKVAPHIDAGKLTAWYDFQARFYHFWRDDYATSPLVERVCALLEGRQHRLLDAGCGSGFLAIGLALRQPGWTITGTDRSTGLLALARREAQRRSLGNVTFDPGDVTALAYDDGSFTAVTAAGLFPNLGEPGSALREIHRVLEPGGTFVAVEFDRAAMGWSTRLFFRVMIAGYRVVSTCVPRFRFAEQWDIEKSTVDRPVFAAALGAAGFAVDSVLCEHQHLFFVCRRL